MSAVDAAKCPICGKATTEKTKPFCSPRCADIDLGRWMLESYKLPETVDNDEEELPSLPGASEDI